MFIFPYCCLLIILQSEKTLVMIVIFPRKFIVFILIELIDTKHEHIYALIRVSYL